MKYNYETGQITRDFHLKKEDARSCDKSNLPAGVHCFGCEHYKGRDYGFVKCSFISKDDEGASEALSWMYLRFKYMALAAYCD